MSDEQVTTGTIPLVVKSVDQPCSTYYKVIGDLNSGNPPLVALHGGPGSGHEYLLPFTALWSRHKLPVVFYDQVGCASSTHLRHKAGDHAFWTAELFIQQLESVLDALHLRESGRGFYLLGHSFGGILASYFASRQPRGLRKLIIASSPASFGLYVDSLRLNWKLLSHDAQEALEEATRSDDYTSRRYKDAELSLMKTFWCRADPFPPPELEARMRHQADDSTVFTSVYGPNLLQCTGSLSKWDCVEALSNITVPTLVYNGEYDTVRQIAYAPIVNAIPGAREATIKNASHMAHLDTAETREQVLEIVGSFLSPNRVS